MIFSENRLKRLPVKVIPLMWEFLSGVASPIAQWGAPGKHPLRAATFGENLGGSDVRYGG
jgi:hypothetical protein